MTRKLNVILPCAGFGTRLGLPMSKELMPVDKSTTLIDLTFSHFTKCKREEVEFSITIDERKLDLIAYLGKYADNFDMKVTYYNKKYSEFCGSLKSAAPLINDYNVLLLPDTYILHHYASFADEILNNLEIQQSFFIAKESIDPENLKAKGCLQLSEEGEVNLYQDKPVRTEGFNAVWCGIAFRKHQYNEVVDVLSASTYKQEGATLMFEQSCLFKSKILLVEKYIDLGTWPDLSDFIMRRHHGNH